VRPDWRHLGFTVSGAFQTVEQVHEDVAPEGPDITYENAATELSLSVNTASFHVRKIYDQASRAFERAKRQRKLSGNTALHSHYNPT
jgi:hypothetical protein